jgi:hypothetical protein
MEIKRTLHEASTTALQLCGWSFGSITNPIEPFLQQYVFMIMFKAPWLCAQVEIYTMLQTAKSTGAYYYYNRLTVGLFTIGYKLVSTCRLEATGQHEKAAAFAIFHCNIMRALLALQNSVLCHAWIIYRLRSAGKHYQQA